MVLYFDSSFVLSALLEERPEADHAPWDQASQRLSSELLRYECYVALRRAALGQPGGVPRGWVEERMTRLEECFDSITFKAIDASIERIVRGEERLGGCRALDAIHVATALYFAPHLEERLEICSFDARMRRAAAALGFPVRPSLEVPPS